MPSAFSVSATGSIHSGENTPTICRVHAGRIGERPEQVEDGARAEFDAHRADMAHGRVMRRREHEADAGLADAARDRLRRQVDLDAERHQHVGGARLRGQAAVAVLGDRHAAAGDDEGRRRRDVDAVRIVAARADDVDGVRRRLDRQHLVAHRGDRAGDLRRRVSPRTRSAIRKAPIWPGVASPDMMMSKASRASSKESGAAGGDLGDMWLERAHRVRAYAPARSPSRSMRTLVSAPCRRATSSSSRSSARPRREGLFLSSAETDAGVGAGRLEHFGDLEHDARVAGRGRRRRRCRPRATREDGGDAVLAEIAVVGRALQAALGLLLELQFGRERIERARRPSASFPARRRARSSRRCVSAARPVGNHLGRHLVQRALARGRDAVDLEEDEAVGADVDAGVLDVRLRSRRPR